MKSLRRPRTLLSLLAVGAAVAVAGCGDGGGGGGTADELAALIPGDAPIYIEAAVNPEGELRANIDAIAERVAGVDNAVDTLYGQLDSQLEGSGFSFSEDIEPWLGERAALYVSGIPNEAGEDEDGDETRIAGVIETTDEGAAQDAIDKLAEDAGDDVHDEEHGGVTYKTDGGFSVGVVDGFLVISNTPEGLESVIDAADGDSLADTDAYADAIGEAPEGSLANIYVSIGDLLETVKDRVDPSTLDALNAVLDDAQGQSVLGSLVPGTDQVEISFATNAATAVEPGDATDTLGGLPGNALAALAVPDVGKALGQLIDQLDSSGIPGQLEPGELREQAQALGINIDEITGSIGDIGVYATGTNASNLGGAAVISTTDNTIGQLINQFAGLAAAAGESGIRPLGGGLEGFSFQSPETGGTPVVLITSANRIVVGYGLAAARDALSDPQQTLAANPVFESATEALGTGLSPSLFVDIAPVARLLIDSGAASDVNAAEVLPFIEKLTFLIAGAGTEGDLSVSKAIIGLAR